VQQRFHFITVIRKLTKPLITAYHAIIQINTRSRPLTLLYQSPEALPLYDHLPADTHTVLPVTDPAHPEFSEELAERIAIIEVTIPQDLVPPTLTHGPQLTSAALTLHQSDFHISDAAQVLPHWEEASNSDDADSTF
jgi:hypothetical protein